MWNCFENYESPSKVLAGGRELKLEPGGLIPDPTALSKGLSNYGHWRSHRCPYVTSRMAPLGLWGRQLGRRKGNWGTLVLGR